MRTRARKLLAAGRAIASHGRSLSSDGLFVGGGAVACRGVYLFSPALGYLAIGVLLAGVGVLLAPSKSEQQRPPA